MLWLMATHTPSYQSQFACAVTFSWSHALTAEKLLPKSYLQTTKTTQKRIR